MINLQWFMRDGSSRMDYDVPIGDPIGDDSPIMVPDGAVSVSVWMGTTPARHALIVITGAPIDAGPADG